MKIIHRLIIIGILIVTILTVSPIYTHPYEVSISIPTTERLEETKTEHFRIISQESLREAVPYIAKQCEEAYQKLTDILGWYPERRIELFFIDAFDTHNGWATSIPHNRMTIYAAGAEPGSSIFQPGNYLRRTIYHELAHVLSMDMRYGYNRVLSSIFGKILLINDDPLSALLFLFSASPVLLAPEWYLEGIAIWAETEFAPPGRGGLSIPDMIFRCAVKEKNLLPYKSWDLEIPYWPYGLGAYLYGMKLIQYVYETSSADEPLGDLVQNLAHSFMFKFDNHSLQVADWRFEMLVHKMFQHETEIQLKNLEELKKLELTDVPRLTNREIIVYQPVFVGNRIYFIAQEEETRDSLYVYIPEENRTQKIANVHMPDGFGSLSDSPDSRFIYYTRLEVQDKDNYFYEVHCFDTERQKDTLITDSGRYRAIDVSPDGLRLVAASMRAGKSYLVEMPIAEAQDPNQERILACGEFQENLASPRYSPDGKHIAYVRGNEDGFSLLVFDRKKGTSHLIYHSRHQLLFPAWSPDNKRILFSSDESGVYNLYEISKDGTDDPVPLTHVSGGIFASDFAPDGKRIAAVAYDSNGYYLTLLPYEPLFTDGKKLPCINTGRKGKRRGNKDKRMKAVILEEDSEPQPYYSLKNIHFDYWGPWLTASPNGIMGGIGAKFSDPAGFQDLRLVGGFESEYETEIGSVHYIYRGLYPAFHLFAGKEQEIYPDLLRAADGTRYDYAEEVRALGAAVDIPLIKTDRRISLQLGYQLLDRDFIEDSRDDYWEKTIQTGNLSEESEGAVWIRLDFFNGTAFRRSSSIEDGRFINITMEKTDPKLGGDLSQTRTLVEWNEYISNPWIKNHVLKLSGYYGFGEGDRTAQGLFGLGGFGIPTISKSLGMQRSITLRGYDENFQTGDRITKVACAYRFPILDISKNASGSKPVYYKQLFAEVFYEGGRTWDEKEEGDDQGWINATGFEVNLSVKLFRFLRIAPGLGFVFAADRPKNDSNNNDNKKLDERFQLYISIKGFVNF